jgi:hypothetical protein
MIKWKSCTPLFLLPVGLVLLFFPVLFFGKTLFLRDLTYLFHPWKSLCSEMVIKGQVPLWNPYACSGMPLLANWQTGVFYPFSILFYLLPFSLALKSYQIFHLFLAGLFAWLFVRSRGLSRWPSLITAVLFSMNGYLLSRLEFLSHIGVDAWLFALFLFAGNTLALSLALSFSFLAGHQMFFVTAVLLLLYGLIHDTSSPAVSLKNVCIASVLLAGLCACQLLPTMELSRISARVTGGIDVAKAMVNSLQLRDILSLLNPLLFPSTLLPIAGEKFPWAGTFYTGIAGTLLTIPALLQLPKKRTLLFAGLIAIAGLILSLGSNTIIYPWLYDHIFFFRIFRYPSQFMLLTVAGMALLAGYGAEWLRLKYRGALAVAILAELLLTGANFQATADNTYFTQKPASASFLQGAAAGRFILSPGTESDRYVRGKDLAGSWQEARNLLYGMTSLPYHLPNAYGLGEPLTIDSIKKLAEQAYRAPSAAAARRNYYELGVRYLICRERLSVHEGYLLVYDDLPFIYRIDSLPSTYAVSSGSVTIAGIRSAETNIFFSANAVVPSVILWKEAFYPGWQTYINGKRGTLSKGGAAFRHILVPSGKSSVYQLYKPLTFTLGACISVATIIMVSCFSFYLIRRRRGELHEGI